MALRQKVLFWHMISQPRLQHREKGSNDKDTEAGIYSTDF